MKAEEMDEQLQVISCLGTFDIVERNHAKHVFLYGPIVAFSFFLCLFTIFIKYPKQLSDMQQILITLSISTVMAAAACYSLLGSLSKKRNYYAVWRHKLRAPEKEQSKNRVNWLYLEPTLIGTELLCLIAQFVLFKK